MANMNLDEMFKACLQGVQEDLKQLKHVNILLIGKSGVGKSTLVNALFREPLAATGIGRPVTKRLQLLEREDLPIRVYDTRGLELSRDSQEELEKEIQKLIQDQLATGDPDRYIQVIWYLVNSMSNRIEPTELSLIRRMAEQEAFRQVPICLLLTQAISEGQTQAMFEAVQQEHLPVVGIFPLLAKDYPINAAQIIPRHGLAELVEATCRLLPETAAQSMVNAQNVNLKLKRRQARRVIQASVGTVFGIGAAPIPGADAPLMIAAQTAMLAKISSSYGMPVNRAVMMTLLSAVFGTGAATLIGRQVAGSLLKSLPIGGAVIGGAVSGVTGAALTYALGETYIQVLERILRGEWRAEQIDSKRGRQLIQEIFLKQLDRYKHFKGLKQSEEPNPEAEWKEDGLADPGSTALVLKPGFLPKAPKRHWWERFHKKKN